MKELRILRVPLLAWKYELQRDDRITRSSQIEIPTTFRKRLHIRQIVPIHCARLDASFAIPRVEFDCASRIFDRPQKLVWVARGVRLRPCKAVYRSTVPYAG